MWSVLADIASVLWFLCYDRHQNNTIPSNIRNHQLLDALDMPSDSDFDSDEKFTEDNIVLLFLLGLY